MNETFPSEEKLKSKKLINSLFLEGDSVYQYPIKLIFFKMEKSDKNQFKTGVSVPKRSFKKAVDRNYLKRLLREVYRKNSHFLKDNMSDSYAFMFIYTAKSIEDYNQLFTAMEKLMKKFFEKEKANEKVSAK
ncbi:MAG TPA: ribonuclease P protein component [Salinimicrobium sp.]|nr:ribonuclease P protein component [Salinimicrobium sp.]